MEPYDIDVRYLPISIFSRLFVFFSLSSSSSFFSFRKLKLVYDVRLMKTNRWKNSGIFVLSLIA